MKRYQEGSQDIYHGISKGNFNFRLSISAVQTSVLSPTAMKVVAEYIFKPSTARHGLYS